MIDAVDLGLRIGTLGVLFSLLSVVANWHVPPPWWTDYIVARCIQQSNKDGDLSDTSDGTAIASAGSDASVSTADASDEAWWNCCHECSEESVGTADALSTFFACPARYVPKGRKTGAGTAGASPAVPGLKSVLKKTETQSSGHRVSGLDSRVHVIEVPLVGEFKFKPIHKAQTQRSKQRPTEQAHKPSIVYDQNIALRDAMELRTDVDKSFRPSRNEWPSFEENGYRYVFEPRPKVGGKPGVSHFDQKGPAVRVKLRADDGVACEEEAWASLSVPYAPWICDSGASFHIVSSQDLKGLDVVRTRNVPAITVNTANGAVKVTQEALVEVGQLKQNVWAKVLRTSTPKLLSLGALCMDDGYSFVWGSGCKSPKLIFPDHHTCVPLTIESRVPVVGHVYHAESCVDVTTVETDLCHTVRMVSDHDMTCRLAEDSEWAESFQAVQASMPQEMSRLWKSL